MAYEVKDITLPEAEMRMAKAIAEVKKTTEKNNEQNRIQTVCNSGDTA